MLFWQNNKSTSTCITYILDTNTEMSLTKKIGYTNETVAMLLRSKFRVVSNLIITCIRIFYSVIINNIKILLSTFMNIAHWSSSLWRRKNEPQLLLQEYKDKQINANLLCIRLYTKFLQKFFHDEGIIEYTNYFREQSNKWKIHLWIYVPFFFLSIYLSMLHACSFKNSLKTGIAMTEQFQLVSRPKLNLYYYHIA